MLVAVDEHLEQVDSVMRVAFGGVVALGLEDGVERGVGGVVGARFADRFELAVELWWPVAPAVAQHPLVIFVAFSVPNEKRPLDRTRTNR